VAATSVGEALIRFGPVAPPAEGWAAFVLRTCYGGVMPAPLDTTFPMLVALVAERSAQQSERYTLAMEEIPGGKR
jgi:hypothetical protein